MTRYWQAFVVAWHALRLIQQGRPRAARRLMLSKSAA
jgi:hypothetical protein